MTVVRPLRRPIPAAPAGEAAVTKKALAAAIAMSERWIEERQARDPAFPVHRWGRRAVRYYVSEVQAYLDERRRAA